MQKTKLQALRRAVAVGLRDIELGRVAPLDIEAIKAKARQARKARRR